MEEKKDKSVIVERLKHGVICRNFSGQLTYEIQNAKSSEYPKLRKLIRRKFKLIPMHPVISTYDETMQNHFNGTKIVGVEWDIWSGFIVVAQTKNAEPMISNICSYLESQYET